jgi:predicted PurR-regulated permease PerM
VHRALRDRLGKRRSIAAALSVVIILIVVVLPITAIVTALAGEAAGMIHRITCDPAAPDCDKIDISATLDWAAQTLPLASELAERLDIDVDGLKSQLSTAAVSVSQILATRAVALGQDTLRIAVYFFLMLYLLFFFLRDANKILDGLVRALPFGDERERHLLARFAEVSRATIKGSLVVGIVQGFIGGVLFASVGIGAPVLWGVVMALLSIVPAVGPSLVWIPAAIILIVQGLTQNPDQIVWLLVWQGIIVIAVGVLVIGLVDNLLRPILVGRDTRLPDYLILLSTLGGLLAFGLAGIVIGPIIAAFFLSVWEMAEEEYAD